MDSLSVPGQLDSLGAIAQYVLAAANSAGLEKKASYRLRLAVDEVATNIINYGYDAAGIEGNILIQATIDERSLTIVLEDTALPFDPIQRDEPDDLELPLEQRQIGGLGIYLAMKGVDRFIYERIDNHNRNIFVMNR